MSKTLYALFALLVFLPFASACGCGAALASPEIVNNLKESNAYLVADVQEDGSFYLKPYFRFVSLDKEENLTMVFPLKSLPKGFNAEKITLSEFYQREGINQYEYAKNTQSLDGALKQFSLPNKLALSLYSLGFVGSFLTVIPILLLNSVGMAGSAGAVQSYTFEGGSLDIYKSSSDGTLDQLVKKLGFQAKGKVADIVEKYKDYYVAVLQIQVPAALPQEQMQYFKNSCVSEYEAAKTALKQDSKIDVRELGIYPGSNDASSCNALAYSFITNAVGRESMTDYYGRQSSSGNASKGILLEMKFDSSDTIFYPVSLVESYNYPVSNQQYFVKTPAGKEFKFSSSYALQTAIVGDTRWYEVKNTKQDLEGSISDAGVGTRFNDVLHGIYHFMYENAFYLSLLLYVVSMWVVWRSLKDSERDEKSLVLFYLMIGGIFYAVYRLSKKDVNTAKIFFAGLVFWVVLAFIL